MYKLTRTVSIVSVIASLLLVGSAAQAVQVLYVDAAFPGGDPANTWVDHSPTGYDFTSSGTVTHSAANQSYIFGGGHFAGSGDEDALDFKTDNGDGAGQGEAMTIVAWLKVGSGFQDGVGIISKRVHNEIGWQAHYVGPFNGTEGAGQLHNEGSDGSLMVARWGSGSNRIPDVADGDFHLWVFHADGSGALGGSDAKTALYIDGSLTEATEDGVFNGLTASMLNSNAVRIGGIEDNPNVFDGEIGFIEVWKDALPGNVSAAQYGQTRWNNGNPLRTPEPSSAVLLCMGLAGLAACRRRRR